MKRTKLLQILNQMAAVSKEKLGFALYPVTRLGVEFWEWEHSFTQNNP
jgi:hypothetical protein